jgi:hypothetical protein
MDDEWARDPSVQSMRRVFARMEEVQRKVLDGCAVSAVDPRLGPWRKAALHLFEETWGRLVRRGVNLDEGQMADVYSYCFAEVLKRKGITVPPQLLPGDIVLESRVKEAMQ